MTAALNTSKLIETSTDSAIANALDDSMNYNLRAVYSHPGPPAASTASSLNCSYDNRIVPI